MGVPGVTAQVLDSSVGQTPAPATSAKRLIVALKS